MGGLLVPRYKEVIDKMEEEGRVQTLSKEASYALTSAIGNDFEKSMKEAEKELKKQGLTITTHRAE